VEMVVGHMRANAENAKRFIAAAIDELALEQNKDLADAKHLEGRSVAALCMTAREAQNLEARARLAWLYPGHFN